MERSSATTYGVSPVGTRFVNYLLDGIFSYIFIFLGAFLMGLCLTIIGFDVDGIPPAVESVLGILLLVSYFIFFESIWQRTPGKLITGTKVTMKDGTKPDFWHILGRSFARFIPFEKFSFLFTPIGWHDSLSGTLVVPNAYSQEDVEKIDPRDPLAGKGTNAQTGWIIGVVAVMMIAVIGLLSTLAVVALNSARQKSRDSKRVADVKQIQTALELYFADYGEYPPPLTDPNATALCAGGFRRSCEGLASGLPATTYMGMIPTAPRPPDGECSGKNNDYSYWRITPIEYTLTFCLGGAVGDLSAGQHTATPFGIR